MCPTCVTAAILSDSTGIDTSFSGAFYPLVVIGKPTVIFSADGPTPNSRIQMEVTATPIHLNSTAKP
jgi:hypothetical protein